MKFRVAVLVLVCAFAASCLFAQDIDIPFQKFVLDNGLTVIVHEDHKAPIVAVNLWYHVGSKNEKPGKTGFAVTPNGPSLSNFRDGNFGDTFFVKGVPTTFPNGDQFNFAPGASPLLTNGVHGAVGFMPRALLVSHVQNTEGLALCGRGAACPG